MALNETLNLNITEAQRQIALLESQLNQLSQPVNVPIDVDTAGAEANFQRIAEALGISEDQARAMSGEIRESVAASSRLDSELKDVATALGLSGREADQFVREMRRAEVAARDTADATTQIATKGGSSLKGLITTLKGFGAGFLAFSGFQQITQFIGESITAASNLEQSVGAVDAVFGDLSGTVEAFGRTADQSVGLAASQFNQLASVLGSQLQTFGFNVEDAAAETQRLITLAADLAATFGGPVSDAVEAISSLLRGEVNPIERYGVAMNQAAVEARALEDGLAASASELTLQDQTMARLAILTEQTANAQGQFGREAETTAGRTERLNAELENQRALLGQSLIPLQNQWLEVQTALLPVIGDVASVVGILTGALSAGEAELRSFQEEMGESVSSASQLVNIFREDFGAGQGFLGALFADAFPTLSSILDPGPVQEMAQAIAALVEAGAFGVSDLEDLDRLLLALVDTGELTADEYEQLATQIDNTTRRLENQAEAGNDDVRMFQNLARATNGTAGALNAYVGTINEFDDAAQAAFIERQAQFSVELDADIDEIAADFAKLPTALDAAQEAMKTTEGEIVTDFGTFTDNLIAELEAQAAFTDNINLLEDLGFDDLADQFRDLGIESAGLLADGLEDPGALSRAEDALDAYGTKIDEELRQQTVASVTAAITSVDDLISALASLEDTSITASVFLNLTGPGAAFAGSFGVGSTGTSEIQNNQPPVINVSQTFTDPTTPSTTTARASQSVSSIGNYR